MRSQSKTVECQCRCLLAELAALRQQPRSAPLPIAALALTVQPFPLSIIQNKALDEPICLKLITGALTRVVGVGDVSAAMCVDYQPRSPNELELEHGVATMRKEDNVARFDNLKFKHGTRKKKATLKFRQRVTVDYGGAARELALESNATRPVIVKTNERQASAATRASVSQIANVTFVRRFFFPVERIGIVFAVVDRLPSL